MSAALASLSQYADSDSDDETVAKTQPLATDRTGQPPHGTEVEAAAAPKRPKRKLPPLDLEADALSNERLSRSSSPARAIGNSTGKVVKGDWLCYCFVEVLVDPSLGRCIQDSHAHLQEQLGTEHTLLDLRHSDHPINDEGASAANPSPSSQGQLHISLTRPFTVRSYERDEYVKVATAEVQRLKATVGSFPFTFSRIAYLANDDASRHFMVLEVGAGCDKFHRLSTALSTELRRAFRAKAYYDEARFHASTACVLDSTPDQSDHATQALASRFSTIVADIEAEHGPRLRQCRPVWATRIGIQVANRVSYVDL
ncbi:related to UPF3-Nonsense-mediated mRNA decay protein [Sporisorium reilianum f. sp. reilianum]|uniref:U6 snRNA phosphodiesterase 1 n=1 Tax=Sporisorium reilianum f. sp. reilianum TaxID=72559 RepID=A0A2N8UCI4_9BASI|nr:related to UPF3-Nonsense-mediated mRNA decay protein [Sporisorium reilianum f. sp. reilianum]